MDNLVWTCKSCNTSKGDKTLEEWTKETQEVPEAAPAPFWVSMGFSEKQASQIRESYSQEKNYSQIAELVFGAKSGRRVRKIRSFIEAEKGLVD